jgi:hypothetical protein
MPQSERPAPMPAALDYETTIIGSQRPSYFKPLLVPKTLTTDTNTRRFEEDSWLMRQSAANPSARQIPCYQGKKQGISQNR